MENKQLERELDDLDTALTQLKRDYEIYFSGGAKLPPYESHRKVENQVRKYSRITNLNYAQRFRYNNIQSRFHSYAELWSKQMRNKEEGRTPSGSVLQVAVKTKKDPKKTATQDPQSDHFQKLYNDYLKSRQKTGENSGAVSFEKFSDQVSKQRQAILDRFQCKDVDFFVAVEQGKTKLKAKPIKKSENEE